MKITINPRLYEDALHAGTVSSMNDVKDKSGMNYQTVMKLVKGTFGIQTFKILAKYFDTLGHNPDVIAEMQVKDVFKVE